MYDQFLNVEDDDEAFFMTHIHSPRVSRQPTKTSYVQPTIDIQEWFQATAKSLKQRRQFTLRQGQRMRQIEQQFQKRQSQKKKTISQKLSASESLKQKNVTQIRQRLRKLSQRRHRVLDKVKAEDREQINKHLQERKAFQVQNDGHSFSLNSSKSKLSSSQERIKQVELQIKNQEARIDDKLEELQQKQKKAIQVSHQQLSQKANRAHSHNSIEVPQVRQRAYLLKSDKLHNRSQQALRKLNNVQIVRHNKEKQIHDITTRKHKSFSDKLHRLHNNVLELEQARRQRNEILNQKYAKTYSKHIPDPRATIQSKRLLQNLDTIEKAQKLKAQKVLHRHREMQARNKLIRQRKDNLYKNYVNQTIE